MWICESSRSPLFLRNFTIKKLQVNEMNRRDRVRDPREDILLETNFDDDGSAVTRAYNSNSSHQPLQPQRRNGFKSEQSLDRYSVHGRREGISFIVFLFCSSSCCVVVHALRLAVCRLLLLLCRSMNRFVLYCIVDCMVSSIFSGDCCQSCMTRIPYATLIATLMCLLGVGIFCGTMYRGASLSIIMIDQVFHKRILWWVFCSFFISVLLFWMQVLL